MIPDTPDLAKLDALVTEAEAAFTRTPNALWSNRTYLAPKDAVRLRALISRIEELEAALEPFAKAWGRFNPDLAYTTAPHLFTRREDFRRALSTLSSNTVGGGSNGSSVADSALAVRAASPEAEGQLP